MSVWLDHVKKTRDSMAKGTPLKDILKAAKKTYKKGDGVIAGVVKTAEGAVKAGVDAVKKVTKKVMKGGQSDNEECSVLGGESGDAVCGSAYDSDAIAGGKKKSRKAKKSRKSKKSHKKARKSSKKSHKKARRHSKRK
jgi:hypothetical protein